MKVIIDGKKITSKQLLHTYFADEMKFPEWYGKNLDALFDSLTDINEETEIELINRPALHEHLGEYAKAFEKMLRDAHEENEDIKIITAE